jgi:hypothetical protein
MNAFSRCIIEVLQAVFRMQYWINSDFDKRFYVEITEVKTGNFIDDGVWPEIVIRVFPNGKKHTGGDDGSLEKPA